jgi:hypothetical protein
MNARQRVIAALGGRCAWCQSTARPFEIDHIHGGGNQHHAQLRLPLATCHQQLSTLGTNLGQQIQALDQTLQTLAGLVQTLLTRVTALEERFTAFAADQVRRYEDLQGAYDRLKSSQAVTERGGSWRGFRTCPSRKPESFEILDICSCHDHS